MQRDFSFLSGMLVDGRELRGPPQRLFLARGRFVVAVNGRSRSRRNAVIRRGEDATAGMVEQGGEGSWRELLELPWLLYFQPRPDRVTLHAQGVLAQPVIVLIRPCHMCRALSSSPACRLTK